MLKDFRLRFLLVTAFAASSSLGCSPFVEDDGATTESDLLGDSQLAAGDSFACFLTSGGAVKCWGAAVANGRSVPSSLPAIVPGLSTGVRSIAGTGGHACALLANGTVKCWGRGSEGQLGNGVPVCQVPQTDPCLGMNWSATPVDVVGLGAPAIAIAAGSYHTCAILAGGAVKCWGGNWMGQLGHGDSLTTSTPVDVLLGSPAVQVSAGHFHSCAVVASGKVACWGTPANGRTGQVGISGAESLKPRLVPNLDGVKGVAAGEDHTCALTNDGKVECFGNGSSNQLGPRNAAGDPLSFESATPIEIASLVGTISSLSAGHGYTCAVGVSGKVQCWGRGSLGQLGNGSRGNSAASLVSGAIGFSHVAAGWNFACANAGANVRCWGSNINGELGATSTDSCYARQSCSLTPLTVVGL